MFDGRLRRISKDFSREKCLESVLFGAHTYVRGLNVCINLVGSRKRGEEGERGQVHPQRADPHFEESMAVVVMANLMGAEERRREERRGNAWQGG